MTLNPATEKIYIEAISVPAGRREVDADAVTRLAESMSKIGLRTPITIWGDECNLELVAGAHRLAAAKQLGWEQIECVIMDSGTVTREQAEMWEISENLHRAELTVLQRSVQINRWIELLELQSAQVAPIESKRLDGRGHRQESGTRKAARELNLERDEARRAVKVASLTPEAKQAAKETGTDDNQSVLLEAARKAPEQQADYIRQRAVSPPSSFPQDDHERSIKWRRAFERVWNDAPSLEDREWAKDWIDRPIMDRVA